MKTAARSASGASSCCSQNASPSPGVCQILAKSCHSKFDVGQAGGVGDPRAHEVGPGADEADDEAAAPVVADEVDGPAAVGHDLLELADEPVDVLVLGGTEAGRPGHAEAGQGQGDRVVALEVATDAVPETGGLRDAVDEDGGHGARP